MTDVKPEAAAELLTTTQDRFLNTFGQTTELLGQFILQEISLPEGATMPDAAGANEALQSVFRRAIEVGFNRGREFERQQAQPTEGEQ